MFPGRNVCWDNKSHFFSPLFKVTLKYVAVRVFTSPTWSPELPSSTWRLGTYHIADVSKHRNFESKQQIWRLCLHTLKSPKYLHQRQFYKATAKPQGTPSRWRKEEIAWNWIQFHSGSLVGNMSHVYTGTSHIFELPQASWPNSRYTSLATFSPAFQVLVPPEASYCQWHWDM